MGLVRTTVLSVFLMPAICAAQSPPSDAEILKARQLLCDEFSEAVAMNKMDVLVKHYSQDVVVATTSPDLIGPFVGREAVVKYLEPLPKRVTGYKSIAERAGLRPDGTAWTQGVYTFTIKGPDGNPIRRWGRWVDSIRRNGDRWEVVTQVNATLPSRPNPDPTGD